MHIGPFTARYLDVDPTPLYPFGHGLTYGRIAYGPTRVSRAELAWSETLTVSCEISETAGVAAEDSVFVDDLPAPRRARSCIGC